MSNSEAGWVGALLCAGGFVGSIFFTYCADKFGRKHCLLMLSLPSLAAWLIIPFARTPLHLCVSRFLGGVAGGGAFTVIPLYTTELSDDRVRGTLGTFLVLTFNFGVLLAFILGNYLNYVSVAWILSTFTVLFLLCFSFMPETPQFLIKQNKVKEAEKSFRYYRNIRIGSNELPEQLKSELEKLKPAEKDEMHEENTKITWKEFNSRINRKAIIIGFFLMALINFNGCFPMLNYTASIFKQSKSNLSPKVAAIVVGFIQLLGTYVSTIFVERAGRKLLLVTSAIGMGIGHICFGTYSYLTYLGYNTDAFNWVPVASFSFTIFISCIGVMSLSYVVLSEIMPPKIRNMGVMLCMITLWTSGFLLLKYLPLMSEVLGMHGMVFLFASCCFVGAVIITIFVPETKGKSIDEILSLL